MHPILLGKFLGMEFMGHNIGICLTVKQFSRVVGSSYISTQITQHYSKSFFSFKANSIEKKEKQKLVLMKNEWQ